MSHTSASEVVDRNTLSNGRQRPRCASGHDNTSHHGNRRLGTWSSPLLDVNDKAFSSASLSPQLPNGRQSRRPRQQRAMRSIQASRRGSAKVEYAVMLAFVTATVVLGWHMLGQHTARPLSQLALDLDTTAPGSRLGGPLSRSRVLPRRAAAIEDVAGPAASAEATAAAISPAVAVALVAQVICCVALIVMLYRHRRRASRSEADQEQTAERLDHMVFEKRQQMLHQLASDPSVFATGQLLAHHLMSPPSSSVTPDTPLEQVTQQMQADRVRHLLVRDKSGRLVGIISDRDVHSRSGQTAADIMTPDPITIRHDAPLAPALTMLVRKRISCLPVVRDGGLCGVLTTTDVVLALQCVLHVLENLGGASRPAHEAEPDEHRAAGGTSSLPVADGADFAQAAEGSQTTATPVGASLE